VLTTVLPTATGLPATVLASVSGAAGPSTTVTLTGGAAGTQAGSVDVAVQVVPVVPVVPVVQAGSVDVAVHVGAVVVGGGGVVVSTAGAAGGAASAGSAGVSTGVVSTGLGLTAAGALVSTAVDAFVSTPVAAPAAASVPSGAGAGGVVGIVIAGVGTLWNAAGSMPTLLETMGTVVDVPSPNGVGSTPTELVMTGGVGPLGVVTAAEDAEAAGAGGVTLRLSFTTGTRIVRVAGCPSGCVGAIACVACPFVAAGCLKTRGDADACDLRAFAGTAAGTRNAGKRSGTTLSACRE